MDTGTYTIAETVHAGRGQQYTEHVRQGLYLQVGRELSRILQSGKMYTVMIRESSVPDCPVYGFGEPDTQIRLRLEIGEVEVRQLPVITYATMENSALWQSAISEVKYRIKNKISRSVSKIRNAFK